MRDTQTAPKNIGNIRLHKLYSNRANAHMKQIDGTESLSKNILECVELEMCYVCVNVQTVYCGKIVHP